MQLICYQVAKLASNDGAIDCSALVYFARRLDISNARLSLVLKSMLLGPCIPCIPVTVAISSCTHSARIELTNVIHCQTLTDWVIFVQLVNASLWVGHLWWELIDHTKILIHSQFHISSSDLDAPCLLSSRTLHKLFAMPHYLVYILPQTTSLSIQRISSGKQLESLLIKRIYHYSQSLMVSWFGCYYKRCPFVAQAWGLDLLQDSFLDLCQT